MKNRWRTEKEEKGTLIYYVALCADKLTQNSRGRTIVSEDRLNSVRPPRAGPDVLIHFAVLRQANETVQTWSVHVDRR